MRVAQADALAVQGKLRAAAGGAVAAPRDLVIMTAGFEAAGVNSGDVIGPDPDVEAARAFFAEHGVKWGLRVPEEMTVGAGRAAVPAAADGSGTGRQFRPAGAVRGLGVRVAGRATCRPRCTSTRPRSGSTATRTGSGSSRCSRPSAWSSRSPSSTAARRAPPTCCAPTAAAGPSAYVAGVAVLPDARRRGVAAGVSSWLLERAFARGAELAHLNPDTDAAARIYGRLGFTELSGHDIYVDL